MCFWESLDTKGSSCDGGRENGADGVEERGFLELEEVLNNAFEGLPLDFGGMARMKGDAIVCNSRPRLTFKSQCRQCLLSSSACYRRNFSAPT